MTHNACACDTNTHKSSTQTHTKVVHKHAHKCNLAQPETITGLIFRVPAEDVLLARSCMHNAPGKRRVAVAGSPMANGSRPTPHVGMQPCANASACILIYSRTRRLLVAASRVYGSTQEGYVFVYTAL